MIKLKVKPCTITDVVYKKPNTFPQWTQQHVADDIDWQKSNEKKGRSWLFIPVPKDQTYCLKKGRKFHKFLLTGQKSFGEINAPSFV